MLDWYLLFLAYFTALLIYTTILAISHYMDQQHVYFDPKRDRFFNNQEEAIMYALKSGDITTKTPKQSDTVNFEELNPYNDLNSYHAKQYFSAIQFTANQIEWYKRLENYLRESDSALKHSTQTIPGSKNKLPQITSDYESLLLTAPNENARRVLKRVNFFKVI